MVMHPGQAEELGISLGMDGVLRFNELTNAVEYQISWASDPAGPWLNFDPPNTALNLVEPSGTGSVHVTVPMEAEAAFYRVAAYTNSAINAFSPPVQAEAYAEMSGILLENGDTTVGWYDDGDWLLYERVNFGEGAASVIIHTAKANTGGTVEFRLDSIDGPLIATFVPENTGGWTLFSEQELNMVTVSGVHDLYLVARGAVGVCNIDWFRFSADPVYVPNYVLFWQDEFEGTALDTNKWHPVQHGFVHNGELQFYTDRPENIAVSNGVLWLTAREETYTGTGPWMDGQYKTSEYTSGKVQGQGKISFRYGKFEARMKLPRGEGTWPAFWMLGDNIFDAGWPACGEIDIMEHANVLDNLGAAIHTEAYNHTIGTQKTGTYVINDYDTDFHVYGVEWTADKLVFNVDGNVYFTVTKEQLGDSEAEWPFDQPFWMILNLAVGGAWGGDPSGGSYPYSVEVDWVRVYQDQPQP